MFFERSCKKPDEVIDRICALHNQKGNSIRRVNFSLDPVEILEITPDSETYRSHDHGCLSGEAVSARGQPDPTNSIGQDEVRM